MMLRKMILGAAACVSLAGCEAAGDPLCVVPDLAQAKQNLGNIEDHSLADLAQMMERGETSSEAIVGAYIDRIEALDDAEGGPRLNAVIALMPDALETARWSDENRCYSGTTDVLQGIPLLVKDNIEVAGPVPTTAGSTALSDNVTGRDAPLIRRLKDAGAIILGKTNLSQWANFRSNNSTSGWSAVGGLVKNPHRLPYNSCGSSSGSGSAMAASLAAGTIGTETDGSIICPSSANGVVGLKPTVGLVSRRHIVPISHTQDTAGPMTRTVRDAAMMLSAMAGTDPQDAATAEADAQVSDYASALSTDALNGMRIGVMRSQVGDNPAIVEQFDAALAVMEQQGAILVEIPDRGISDADQEALGEAEFLILLTEFKADLNAYLASTPDTVTTRTLADLIAYNTASAEVEMPHFGQELFLQAQEQPGLTDPRYLEALKTTKRIAGAQGIDRLLRENNVEVLVSPTLGPAWKSTLGDGDTFAGPSASWLPATSGYPHLTVPMGAIDNLPVGISFYAGKWSEGLLLNAGYAYEQASKARATPQFLPE
ncbi:MAG: amidase [Pseudomonadota bacterium]